MNCAANAAVLVHLCDACSMRHVAAPIGSFTSTVIGVVLRLRSVIGVFDLVDVGRDLLEVDLVALAHDVERVADLQIQRLVLRRVHDAIFADELHAAARVRLIDAHRARTASACPSPPFSSFLNW